MMKMAASTILYLFCFMLAPVQGEDPLAFLGQGQDEYESYEPCYVCGGDPAASVQNPEAVLIVPPGVGASWKSTTTTCEIVEILALAGFLDPNVCSLAQNDPIGPRICHCSHLPPEAWLDAYPDDFAYPTVTPRPTPTTPTTVPTACPTHTAYPTPTAYPPPVPTPVPPWKGVSKNVFKAAVLIASPCVLLFGVLYCSLGNRKSAGEVASVSSTTTCRTVVSVPPASVVHVTPPVDDHEAPFAEAVRLGQERGSNKGQQDKNPTLALAVAYGDS